MSNIIKSEVFENNGESYLLKYCEIPDGYKVEAFLNDKPYLSVSTNIASGMLYIANDEPLDDLYAILANAVKSRIERINRKRK